MAPVGLVGVTLSASVTPAIETVSDGSRAWASCALTIEGVLAAAVRYQAAEND